MGHPTHVMQPLASVIMLITLILPLANLNLRASRERVRSFSLFRNPVWAACNMATLIGIREYGAPLVWLFCSCSDHYDYILPSNWARFDCFCCFAVIFVLIEYGLPQP